MSRNSVCLCATSTTPNCAKSTIPSAANSRSDAEEKFSRYSPKPARLSHWRTRPFAEGALPSLRVSTEATGIARDGTVAAASGSTGRCRCRSRAKTEEARDPSDGGTIEVGPDERPLEALPSRRRGVRVARTTRASDRSRRAGSGRRRRCVPPVARARRAKTL